MKITFRKVKIEEKDEVFNMLKLSAEWLKEKKIDYWQEWHNPPKEYIDWIIKGIQNEEFYFAEDDTSIVGMFRLQFNDEMFWSKRTDLSGYIHSFTTNRTHKGKGLGKVILEQIEKNLINEGYDYIRLDCSLKINELCKYYEKCGFKVVGQVELCGEVLNLYEKVLA